MINNIVIIEIKLEINRKKIFKFTVELIEMCKQHKN